MDFPTSSLRNSTIINMMAPGSSFKKLPSIPSVEHLELVEIEKFNSDENNAEFQFTLGKFLAVFASKNGYFRLTSEKKITD
jgi:hypothetical protein